MSGLPTPPEGHFWEVSRSVRGIGVRTTLRRKRWIGSTEVGRHGWLLEDHIEAEDLPGLITESAEIILKCIRLHSERDDVMGVLAGTYPPKEWPL